MLFGAVVEVLSVLSSCLWRDGKVIRGSFDATYQDYFWGLVLGTHASQIVSWSGFEVVGAGRRIVVGVFIVAMWAGTDICRHVLPESGIRSEELWIGVLDALVSFLLAILGHKVRTEPCLL